MSAMDLFSNKTLTISVLLLLVSILTSTTGLLSLLALQSTRDRPRWSRRAFYRFSSRVQETSSPIDYSAANEYVMAHYGIENYFPKEQESREAVYDARLGIIVSRNDGEEERDFVRHPSSIHQNGFQLIEMISQVKDWTSRQEVSEMYLPELRRALLQLDENISSIIFWHPMIRGEEEVLSGNGIQTSNSHLSTAPVATLVHIDTDIQAYSLEQLLSLIDKNRILEDKQNNLDIEEFRSVLLNKRRFAVWNVWRNIGKDVIQRRPLGIYLPVYDLAVGGERDRKHCFFPMARPDVNKSRWYYFSQMTPNECLVFKQYDRNVSCVSDLWHCALTIDSMDDSSLGTNGAVEQRRSFDLRALVIYNEDVLSWKEDRYSEKRSLLTLEESECFCEEQTREYEQRRKRNNNNTGAANEVEPVG